MQDQTCLLSDEFSTEGRKCSSLSIDTKVNLYQALIRYVLHYGAETTTILVVDMKTLEASTWCVSDRYLIYADGLMSPMQRCFRDLVCQPVVTSYVIDAYLCLAMLHAWTLEYQHIMDALHLQRQKANGQLEKTAGLPLQRLGQQGSGGCQHCTAMYAVETWDRQGSWRGTTRTTRWWWWRWWW